MGKIAFIKATAFVCSIMIRVIAFPFLLLAKLLQGIISLFFLCCQCAKEFRERRKRKKAVRRKQRQRKKNRLELKRRRKKEQRLENKERRKKEKQNKKEQRLQFRLERQKLREKIRSRRSNHTRSKKEYSSLIKNLRDKYHDTEIIVFFKAIYAVGIFFVKAYQMAVTVFRKLYWFIRGLFQKAYWFFHGLFQKLYWFFKVLLQKLYWFFRTLLQKTYWFFRGLLQKAYWFFHGLFQKAYWFFHGLLQKAYWFFRGRFQKVYWNFYYPKSRKMYQSLCKNAYMELFFIFLRGYVGHSTGRTSCIRILGTKEYADTHKNEAQYQVVEVGKIRPVCIPEYFEKSKQEIKQFQSPDIYLAELQDVYLIGGSNVTVAGNALLNDAVYQDKEHRIDIRYSAIKNVFDGIAVIEDYKTSEEIEKGINLVGAASFNYYHLVVEILPRLAFVDTMDMYRDYPVLVDEVVLRIPQFQSALECINRLNHPVIKIEKDRKYLIKDMILPSSNVWMPTNVYNREQIQPADFMISDTVLHTIRKSVGVWAERPAWRKIFISRKNTQAVRLKNEGDIRELFVQSGFEIVFTEEMSFRQQVECFGQAKCIVAASGAALTNTVFCQPGTLIGCIIPSSHRFYMYSTIAYILGLTPLYLDAEIIEKTPYAAADTFMLDSEYVKRYIEYIQKYINDREEIKCLSVKTVL